MGCWCETCGVTQLPITMGDKIRVFVLASQSMPTFRGSGGGSCYSNDIWSPIGPAIQGEYDDYGGVENIVNDDAAKMVESILDKNWVSISSEGKWDEIPEKMRLFNYLHYIERGRGKSKAEHRKEQDLGIMFVLEDIYQAMVKFDSVDAHHYYDERTFEYMPKSRSHMIQFEDWYNKQLEIEKDRQASKDANLNKFYNLLSGMDDMRLFGDLRDNAIKAFKKPLQALAAEFLPFKDKKVQKLIKTAIELLMFQGSFDRARKQWMPQSGKGSQDNDLDIYQVINLASTKVIDRREKEDEAYGIIHRDENGYTEWMIEHNQARLKKMEEQTEDKNVKKSK